MKKYFSFKLPDGYEPWYINKYLLAKILNDQGFRDLEIEEIQLPCGHPVSEVVEDTGHCSMCEASKAKGRICPVCGHPVGDADYWYDEGGVCMRCALAKAP